MLGFTVCIIIMVIILCHTHTNQNLMKIKLIYIESCKESVSHQVLQRILYMAY